jgi:hypothetical protein
VLSLFCARVCGSTFSSHFTSLCSQRAPVAALIYFCGHPFLRLVFYTSPSALPPSPRAAA